MYSFFAKHSFLVIAFSTLLRRYALSFSQMDDDTDDETRESRNNASDEDNECRRLVEDTAERCNIIVMDLEDTVASCFTDEFTTFWSRKMTTTKRRIGSRSHVVLVSPQSPSNPRRSCFALMNNSAPEKAAPTPIAVLFGLDGDSCMCCVR